MASGTQRYDPSTGNLVSVDENGQTTPVDASELLGGVFKASGAVLYDPNNPIGHQIRLGQSGPTTITYLDYDRAVVLTPIALSGVNTQRNAPELQSKTEPMQQGQFVVQTVIGGSAVFTLGDGSVVTVDNLQTSITGYGMRIIGEIGPDGNLINIQRKVVDARTNAELEAELGPGMRFATPTEAAGFGIRKWVADNRRSLVNKIADQGGLPGHPIARGDRSGAVRLIAEAIAQNLQAYAAYVVQM